MMCRYCYSAKLDTRVIFCQSIAPPIIRSRANLFKKTCDFTVINMAKRLVFAGRWTKKRHHCTFVCMSITKLFKAITF